MSWLYFISALVLWHVLVIKGESEQCLTVFLPRIRTCDSEIAQIDQFCLDGYQNINAKCKESDTENCATTYHKFTAVCEGKRAVFNQKCQPIYQQYTKECGEIPASYYQKVGPDSFRCLKVLTPAVEVCDKKIFFIDNDCRIAYKNVDKVCKGVDTDECGLKYKNLKESCDKKRNVFFQECNPSYDAYRQECKGTPSVYPPPTGPESDRCLKDLLPKIQRCDVNIAGIDKYCTEQYNKVDELCKGKDTDECSVRFKNVKTDCEQRRSAHSSECTPLFAAFKTECKEATKKPTTGPESDRCVKELIPGIQACDEKALKIEKSCADGFKAIDSECKGKDTTECELKYKNFQKVCKVRLAKYKKICNLVNNAYKRECTGPVPNPLLPPKVDIESCADDLIQAAEICDENINNIDKNCRSNFQKIHNACTGKKTVECGLQFQSLTDNCKDTRIHFWKICGILYRAYMVELEKKQKMDKLKLAAVKEMEHFHLLKESFRAVSAKVLSTKATSKTTTAKATVTSKKATTTKPPTVAKAKPAVKSVKPEKLSKAAKKISTQTPIVQLDPEEWTVDQCSKRLLLEVSACDDRTTKTDAYCSREYHITTKNCQSISRVACGINYHRLSQVCWTKRKNNNDKCDPVYDEYHEKCEGLCPKLFP